MALEFEWDPRKAAANRAKHGVGFDEAATAFADPLGHVADDPRHSRGEERFVLLGRSQCGRLLAVMFTPSAGRLRSASSAPAGRPAMSDKSTKPARRPAKGGAATSPKSGAAARPRRRPARVGTDDILPEYDFRGARPNKYATRFAQGTNLVLLDPDVARAFPDAAAVNDALRALAGIAARTRPAKRPRSTRRTA